MARFHDKQNREWEITITMGMLPKLREAGFNVGAIKNDAKQFAALDDPEMFGKVLWVLCGTQAEAKKITPEDFAEAFDGEAVFAAFDALMEALADFIHRPNVSRAIKIRMPEAMANLEQATIAKVESRMKMIRSGLSGGDGSSPALPDSIPEG